MFEAAAVAVAAAGTLDEAVINKEAHTGACEEAARKLAHLGEQQVTAALLSKTGLGLKVKALTKCRDKRIELAAKSVIASWKAEILQQRTTLCKVN